MVEDVGYVLIYVDLPLILGCVLAGILCQVVQMFGLWLSSQIYVVLGGSEWNYAIIFAVDFSKVKWEGSVHN